MKSKAKTTSYRFFVCYSPVTLETNDVKLASVLSDPLKRAIAFAL